MGNHKFRLSDMIPNFRFYKLKHISSRPKNQKNTHPTKKNGNHLGTTAASAPPPPPPSPKLPPLPPIVQSDQRKSYHFTRELTFQSNSPAKISAVQYSEEPARLFSGKRRSTKKTCKCKIKNGVVCDPDVKQLHAKSEGILNLAPIITKVRDSENHMKTEANSPIRIRRVSEKIDERNAYESESINSLITDSKDQITSSLSFRKSSVQHSQGMKLRHRNSPRLGRRNIPARKSSSSSSSSSSSWKSGPENFAVVKSSADPQRDFRESMVEMIVENNIKASKDLEELLACYLSLNCAEYHDLIIKVFKQIWFDTVADIRLN